MLLCVPSIWLSNNQRNRCKDSWNSTGSHSSAPDANMWGSEIVEEPWGIEIIDRGNSNVDNSTGTIKSFLESIMTAVFDRNLRQHQLTQGDRETSIRRLTSSLYGDRPSIRTPKHASTIHFEDSGRRLFKVCLIFQLVDRPGFIQSNLKWSNLAIVCSSISSSSTSVRTLM